MHDRGDNCCSRIRAHNVTLFSLTFFSIFAVTVIIIIIIIIVIIIIIIIIIINNNNNNNNNNNSNNNNNNNYDDDTTAAVIIIIIINIIILIRNLQKLNPTKQGLSLYATIIMIINDLRNSSIPVHVWNAKHYQIKNK